MTSQTRYEALACWPRPDLGLVRPTYQCVPSHRAPGVTAGSGVAPPASSAARPGELGAGDSLPRAELSGVKSDALLPAAARARSRRCRWFLACSARSIHGQPSGSAAAERLPRGELPSCPRDPRACGATGEVVGVVGRGSLYYGYTTYLLWLCLLLHLGITHLFEAEQHQPAISLEVLLLRREPGRRRVDAKELCRPSPLAPRGGGEGTSRPCDVEERLLGGSCSSRGSC